MRPPPLSLQKIQARRSILRAPAASPLPSSTQVPQSSSPSISPPLSPNANVISNFAPPPFTSATSTSTPPISTLSSLPLCHTTITSNNGFLPTSLSTPTSSTTRSNGTS